MKAGLSAHYGGLMQPFDTCLYTGYPTSGYNNWTSKMASSAGLNYGFNSAKHFSSSVYSPTMFNTQGGATPVTGNMAPNLNIGTPGAALPERQSSATCPYSPSSTPGYLYNMEQSVDSLAALRYKAKQHSTSAFLYPPPGTAKHATLPACQYANNVDGTVVG